MGRWIKTNLLSLIVTIALTALFGWLLSTSDKLKDTYTAHAIENATDITTLKVMDKTHDKTLADRDVVWGKRMDTVELKLDKIITQNAQETATSREMLGELRGIQRGMKENATK